MESIFGATTHPDSTINFLAPVGVTKWIQNIIHIPDEPGIRDEVLNFRKIRKSFGGITSKATRLFPTFSWVSFKPLKNATGECRRI